MLMPHQQRVVAERDELAAKARALATFLQGDVYAGLPLDERDRLARQCLHMTSYWGVLDERIAAFGGAHA